MPNTQSPMRKVKTSIDIKLSLPLSVHRSLREEQIEKRYDSGVLVPLADLAVERLKKTIENE